MAVFLSLRPELQKQGRLSLGILILSTRQGVCLSGRFWGSLWGPPVWATSLADNGSAGSGETLFRCLALLVEGAAAQANFARLVFEWGGNCWELPMFQIVPWKRRACPGLW